MSLGLAAGTLRLVDHDPAWAMAFARLSDDLLYRLPTGCVIHHIGSTAVPDLPAKPILDLAVAADPTIHDTIATILTGEGWIDRGKRSGRLFIRLMDPNLRTHNLHLYEMNSSDLADQLVFRDRLRADADLRAAYASHKRALLDASTPRHRYADAKTRFIWAALGRSRSAS